MKARFLMAVLVVTAVVAGRSLMADSKPGADVKCPISGKAVNPDATADFNGGKVYFCCENCPGAFTKDPAKYAAKANHQLVQTGQLKQTACPLTGRPMNAAAAVDVAGVKVALCCNNCKGKVESASADQKLELLFANTKKGFAPAK